MPLSEEERAMASILRVMMANPTGRVECVTYLAPEYQAVWEKMQNGSKWVEVGECDVNLYINSQNQVSMHKQVTY